LSKGETVGSTEELILVEEEEDEGEVKAGSNSTT
jgi:hypothetical protein